MKYSDITQCYQAQKPQRKFFPEAPKSKKAQIVACYIRKRNNKDIPDYKEECPYVATFNTHLSSAFKLFFSALIIPISAITDTYLIK